MHPSISKITKLAILVRFAVLLINLGVAKLQAELQHKVAFGVYDINGSFNQENILVEHEFVTWRLGNATEFIAALKKARQANRFPMVTLES